ncbi:MAG: S9 family peptidase [Thermonemataceae bacterium]
MSYVTFSPDGQQVAYVRDNNLFLMNLKDQQEITITKDGKLNEIINGSTDWVYEEEFGFAKAFFWSSDSKKVAYYRFDESAVKEYNMQVWDALYPTDYRFKYPKAGEENASVEIWVYDITTKNSQKMDIGSEQDIYIPRVQWTKDANLLSIRRMNRLQNQLDLLHADVRTGKATTVLTENSKAYVDVEFTDDLTYLEKGKQFIHASEKSGYKHLYLYNLSGKMIRPITTGNWEVSEIAGIDEKKQLIYFTATKESPLERHLYVVPFKGGTVKKLSQVKGTHSINMSKDQQYYIDAHSTANTPPVTSLRSAKDGKLIKVLEENKAIQEKMGSYQITPKTFLTIDNKEGTALNAWMIKPADFDENKKYPVLMFVYGGPGSQQVLDSWDTFNYFWYQHLAAQGYVVACVDNRGTGGRGAAFRQATYKQLGKLETEDQIAAAEYLAGLDYVDEERMGIWGWSYGGYMAALCITKGAEVFKTAISVAPVVSWRFYDTIYTERYLQRPQDNPEGYDDNSPLNHAEKLKGNYLLVHGTGDDNVHFQNAVVLQDALIKANKQFESFYYPNKNHGIYGGNTRLHLYQLMTDFLKRKL